MNEGRREIVQLVFALVGIVFLVKLFFVQVLDNKYAELADGNAILREVEYPFRGLIYDRNNKEGNVQRNHRPQRTGMETLGTDPRVLQCR